MQGIGGDIWSLVPVVGGPVADVRHLGNALDEPHLGRRDRRRDLAAGRRRGGDPVRRRLGRHPDVWRKVVRRSAEASDEPRRPRSSSSTRSHDSALGVGTRLADARDEAAGRWSTRWPRAHDRVEPLAERCPTSSAAEGERNYLAGPPQPGRAALLRRRAADLRPDGRLGRAGDDRRDRRHRPIPACSGSRRWPKVEGNPLPRGQAEALDWPPSRPTGRSPARSCSAAGERMRGQQARRPDRRRRRRPGRPARASPARWRSRSTARSTATTFIEKLVGRLRRVPRPTRSARRLNRAMVPIFADRLLGPATGWRQGRVAGATPPGAATSPL